jgi:hypothetical protein
VIGVGLLIVLAQLALGVAGRRDAPAAPPPGAPRPFLEVGKSYSFALAARSEALEPCKVLEPPHDNWVKVKARGGDATTWVNLNQVAWVMLLREGE